MRPIHIAILSSGLLLVSALLYDVYNSRPLRNRSVLPLRVLPDIKADGYLYLGIFSLHLAGQRKR